jgi:hypothetical protein
MNSLIDIAPLAETAVGPADMDGLRNGSPTQQRAHAALRSFGLPDLLAPFNPTLTGTVPLDLGLPGSELELLCEVRDLEGFQRVLRELFGDVPGSWTIRKRVNGTPTVLARFTSGEFPVEIYGQQRKVDEQEAYVLMALEDRLLKVGGEPLRLAVLSLRQAGMKTEAAFAECLGLKGDPYRALLELAPLPDTELAPLLQKGSS